MMNRKPVHGSASADVNRQSASRLSARRLLSRLLGGASREPAAAERGRLMLEPLEARQMLAGDVDWLSTDPHADLRVSQEDAAQFSTAGLQAEGEAADDLVAFARALADAGVTYFGAAWCPFCTEQRELFEDGGAFLPFVEVTNPDRTLNEIGQQEGISTFPTWDFPDGTRATGILSLQELSNRSGVAIPQSDQPSFAPVGDQTVEIGSPLHIGIDGYDPDSESLTVSVSVADPTLLEASVLTNNNRSARMTVQGWGEMVFELFEDRAPRPTGRFIELAQAGFYDAGEDGEIIFHRVIDNFVLQAGDPTGTGSGGSTLGDFDDQFHPDLQHNTTGVLSYAKSLDDTNDSQFFITEGQQRHLDFNHSIFGQLVEGDAVREAISETKVTSTRPDTDIVIDSVEIFQDNENSVVMLKAIGGATGETDVTITMTDGDGNSFSEVITVTVIPDQVNAAPFLDEIGDVVATSVPAVFQLGSTDLEGDPVIYEARVIDNSGATASVDQATGEVTVTPVTGFSGEVQVEVGVRAATTSPSTNPSTRSSTMDLQVLSVNFGPQAPIGITLQANSDSGISSSDGITNLAPISFTVTGVNPGATVEVLAGDVQIGVGQATSTSVTIVTNNFAALGNATHIVSARQTVNNVVSSKSPTITVTYDTVAPAAIAAPPSQATVGVDYVADLQSEEEGTGLRYQLVSGPEGLAIAATTGLITWTPTANQAGDQDVIVRLTDAAGNDREQTFSINVGAEPLVTIRLEATDLDGNVLTQLAPGQEFNLNIFGDDERLFGQAQGIFALYLDIFFDENLAEPSFFTPEPTAADPEPSPTIFTYSPIYNSGKSGTPGAGFIDEAGAFSSQTTFLGPGERFIFSARMKALQPGTLTISTDPADQDGNEVALFDRDDEVPASRISYGALTIEIDASFTARPDSATVSEDSTSNPIDVLANDTILSPGTTLSIDSVSAASSEGGSVTTDGSAVFYTPLANFFGTDTFTYVVSDQAGNSQTATVTVNVTAVNDPPTAVDDTIELAGNTQDNRIDVLDNDTIEPDTGETLRVVALSTPSNGGSVRIGTGGTHVLYTPASGFVGTETFTYTISDGSLEDTATVTVTVNDSTPPPIAVDDNFTIAEDSPSADYDVLANDFTEDPDETFALSAIVSVANGTATISPDGTRLGYQPNADFFGVDRVVYSIQGSNGGTASATATFTVTAVNDPPPAPNLERSFARGSAAVVVLDVESLNELNVDGPEALTIQSVGETTAGGTVQIDAASGRILYTPPSATFIGEDSFTYTIVDPGNLTAEGTIDISVLDFTPRNFDVMIHAADMSAASMPFSGDFRVQLRGTNFQGNPVDVSQKFDANTGIFRFADQAPGEYEIIIPGVPFVFGGENERVISFSSAADETSPAPIDVSVGNLKSEYVNRRDFLGSASLLSAFVAVRPGEQHQWISMPEVEGIPENVVVSLSENGEQLTVEIDDPDSSGRLRVTLPLDSEHVDHRASEAGFHLFRLNLDPDDVDYTAVTAGGGEGEATQPASGSQTLASSSTAEGEATNDSQPLSPASSTTSLAGNAPAANSSSSSATTPFSTTPFTSSSTTAAAANGAGLVAEGLVAEGEAGPLDGDNSGVTSTPIARDSGESNSTAPANTKQQATDSAMLDLLPQLERRSVLADRLAESDGESDASAVDATFAELADDQL